MFISLFEEPEAEVARLAAAREGSTTHALSKLPVNIEGWLEDLMIELPTIDDSNRTMIVVPFRYHQPSGERPFPRRRHDGSWDVIVVASNDERYKVGGHRLCVSEAELVRGQLRTFELPEYKSPTVAVREDLGSTA
jgi:hypothetical protein